MDIKEKLMGKIKKAIMLQKIGQSEREVLYMSEKELRLLKLALEQLECVDENIID